MGTDNLYLLEFSRGALQLVDKNIGKIDSNYKGNSETKWNGAISQTGTLIGQNWMGKYLMVVRDRIKIHSIA